MTRFNRHVAAHGCALALALAGCGTTTDSSGGRTTSGTGGTIATGTGGTLGTGGTVATGTGGMGAAGTGAPPANMLGHSVAVAERHYLGVHRGISKEAHTLEAAMQIETHMRAMISQNHRERDGVVHVAPVEAS